jgi:transcriptional regulator with XRE-family HTH domain
MALRRMSQRELAAQLSIGQATLSDRQRNNSWRAVDLPAVARALGVDVAALYEGVEPATASSGSEAVA